MEAIGTLPGRREKRKLETRARIEDAAYALFKLHGIEETSIEQICARADVARRTFYGHYTNKQVLLQALSHSRVFGTADRMINDIMLQHSSTRDRMSAMLDYMQSNISSYDDIDRRLLLVVPGSVDDETHLRHISMSLQDHFTEFFRLGQTNGDVSAEFSPELQAEMVMGTLNNLMINWAVDKNYPIFQQLKEARRFFEKVICSP
jgi:AcrR family transcriptional regulator